MERIGKYQVLGKLGQGGMGTVYRVTDPDAPGRELALKQVVLGALTDTLPLERFLREAQVLARVEHPGVVRVHDHQQVPGGAFLVQELVEGASLKDALRTQPFEPQRAARVVAALADAVAAVHRQGVLHRDLKPSNVMLRADGSPVLLDFGIARDLTAETLTQSGASVGTPTYMAPEQAGGEAVDERTDVYGLGVVLYELLAGQPPFEGPALNVIKRVLSRDPAWPSTLRDDVPPALEAILVKAMAKDPAARYAGAQALRTDLERFLAGEVPAAVGVRPRRRGPVVAVAVLVVAALGLLAWRATGPQPAAAAATPAPTPRARPAAPRELLWSAPVGHAFVVALTFDERADRMQIRMDARMDCVVESGDDDTLTLRMTLRTIQADFRVDASEAPAGPETAVSRLVAPLVGEPLRAQLEREHGRLLELRGLGRWGEVLVGQRDACDAFSQHLSILDPSSYYNVYATLRGIFSRENLSVALGQLTHAGEPPWIGFDAHVPGQSYTFQVHQPHSVLEFQINAPKGKDHARVKLTGDARYLRGVLHAGRVHQVSEMPGAEQSAVTWTWAADESGD